MALVSTRPILNPLTTTFIPPAACSLWAANPPEYSDYGLTGPPPFLGGQICTDDSPAISYPVLDDNLGCLPPAQGAQSNRGFYSPGLVCPKGYTTACSNFGPNSFKFDFQLTESETAYGCCPSGLTCAPNDPQMCSTVTTSKFSDAVTCNSRGLTSYSYSGVASLGARLVQIVFKAGDLTLLSTLTTSMSGPGSTISTSVSRTDFTGSTSVIQPGSTGSATITQAGSQPTRAAANNGLSTTAKTGIGVGFGLAGGLILVAILFIIYQQIKRRRRTNRRGMHSPGIEISEPGVAIDAERFR